MDPRPTLSRRAFVQAAAATAGALAAAPSLHALAPRARAGDDPPPIPNEIVERVMRERFGDRPIRTGHVELDMPLSAEDGRVVPVIVASDLPMTPARHVKTVHLIVDFNPDAHLAAFHLTPAIGRAEITTRIKMKRATWVRAIVETSDGELWADYARVSVTLNGCG